MNRTVSNKVLLLIIAVLLLTNIAVLVYFLRFRHDPSQANKSATELLKEQVGFSQEQLDNYRKLRDQQKEVIKPMYESMRLSKDSLFRRVGDSSVTTEQLELLADRIGQKQKSLDLLAFRHFSELRKICRPEQRVAYDSMVVQMFRKMGRPQNRKGDEKK